MTIAATTDNYGYEVYWELLPSAGTPAATGPSSAAGTMPWAAMGRCAEPDARGYLNNTTYTEGPWCLTLGASYDIFWADDGAMAV